MSLLQAITLWRVYGLVSKLFPTGMLVFDGSVFRCRFFFCPLGFVPRLLVNYIIPVFFFRRKPSCETFVHANDMYSPGFAERLEEGMVFKTPKKRAPLFIVMSPDCIGMQGERSAE